jgi:predicted nucleic acid-binding protein
VTYLLDTNVVSETRKHRPAPEVVTWLADVDSGELHLSVMTIGEVRRGIERLRRRDASQAAVYEAWLGTLETAFADRILGVDVAVADAWGRISADPVPAVDGLLAATALVHGLTVVTRDIGPFERVGVPFLDPWAVP